MAEETTTTATSTASTALKITLLILYYISYPIGLLLYYLLFTLLSLLHLLSKPLTFLLQPFTYISRFILACIIFPFQLLVKLETIYIFLSIAAITGLTLGLTLAFISGSLTHLFGLDKPEDDLHLSSRRSRQKQQQQSPLAVKQYQYRDYSSKQNRGRSISHVQPQSHQQQQNVMTLPEALKSPKSPEHLSPTGGYFSVSSDGAGAVGARKGSGGGRRGRSLLDQTIIEEVDSDF